jgi:hypothetical protein
MSSNALELIDQAIEIGAKLRREEIEAETAHKAVFALHYGKITPALGALGLRFSWLDPDEDYDVDVFAYVRALAKFRPTVALMISKSRDDQ